MLSVQQFSRHRTSQDQATTWAFLIGNGLDGDVQRLFILEFVGQRSDSKLLKSIIRVGNQFSQEHVAVRIQAVDNNLA